MFIGVDLHKQHHTAVIINFWNEKLGEIRIGNKPTAFPELLIDLKEAYEKRDDPYLYLWIGGYRGVWPSTSVMKLIQLTKKEAAQAAS